jgi:integrase
MSKSTRKPRPRKAAERPKKPYPGFPLTPHASGAWQKKIRGKTHYFGKWARRVNGVLVPLEGDTWKDALEAYKVQADDLHAGRTPRTKTDGLTVAELGNRFLTAKLRQREAGEIGTRMFDEYKGATDLLVATFGLSRRVDDLAADDFEALREAMAKRWGPVRLGNEIQRVRTVFKYGFESGFLTAPVRYGPQFKKPSAGVLRRHRAKNGLRMLEADEVRKLLAEADPQLRAMLLLGVNCGFGNHDVATLPLSALDLEGGWADFPRPKTGIPRRCPLWPETVAALREALAARPEPRTDEAKPLVFLTARGRPCLVRGIAQPVGRAARGLMKKSGLGGAGLGFYTLRHVFRTVADAARDTVAIDVIMGHSDPSMGGRYRERVEDGRLKAVAEYVRGWLFGPAPGGAAGPGEPPPAGPYKEGREFCDPTDPCDPAQENKAFSGVAEPAPLRPRRDPVATPLRLFVG